MNLKEKLKPYEVKARPKPNKTIEYECICCGSQFKVVDTAWDYTDAVYCINCGSDTLVNMNTG